MRTHFFGAAMLLHLTGFFPNQASAQDRFRPTIEASYLITRLHDRVTDSTRISAVLRRSSRPFGLKSRAWLDISFAYAGRRMISPPAAVMLTLESVTPARGGGWAFAHPRKLHVRSGRTLPIEIPAARYIKWPVGLFDSRRREMLSFQIRPNDFASMLAQPELELKAGGATFRFRAGQMDALRNLLDRMMTIGRAQR